MNHNKICTAIAAISLAIASAHAGEMPVSLGVRAGVNHSSLSADRLLSAGGEQHNTWKTGATFGVVAAFKFSRHFALQPGLFIDIQRTGYSANINLYSTPGSPGQDATPLPTGVTQTSGTVTIGNAHVPVLFSYRLPLANVAELQFNAGPYISWAIGGSDCYSSQRFGLGQIFDPAPAKVRSSIYGGDNPLLHRLDAGAKIGLGVLILHHYHLSAHYLAGCRNLAADRSHIDKARTKEWQFTIGYNF